MKTMNEILPEIFMFSYVLRVMYYKKLKFFRHCFIYYNLSHNIENYSFTKNV
jgi:hypothetical protein